MKYVKLAIPVLFSLLLLSIVTAINLYLPTDAQAGPLAGFTPSVDDSDDDGDDDDNPPPPASQPNDSEGRAPTDYVMVQMSQCDMTCVAGTAQGDQPDYELLAYSVSDTANAPLLVPIANNIASLEVIAPVRLVHEGSGFIAEGTISTQHSTHFSVPYPGYWEVFLTGQPQLATGQIPDLSRTNLAQLQANLADEPISMGVIEANTETAQMVRCPIECVIETPPAAVPQYLPETGDDNVSPIIFLLIIGLTLIIAGFSSRVASRAKASQENK